MATATIEYINGTPAIKHNAFGYCNTRYHAPYLAIIDTNGGMDWQRRLSVGYGKHAVAYYDISALKAGDLVQMAGGSGGNKYPFKGEVVRVDLQEGTLDITPLNDKEFGNRIAMRKQAQATESGRIDALAQERATLLARLAEIDRLLAALTGDLAQSLALGLDKDEETAFAPGNPNDYGSST